HIAACFAVPLVALAQAADDLGDGRYGHVMFGALIGFGGLYGLQRLIGLSRAWADLTAGLPRWRPRLIRRGRRPALAGGNEYWYGGGRCSDCCRRSPRVPLFPPVPVRCPSRHRSSRPNRHGVATTRARASGAMPTATALIPARTST